MTSEIP